MGPNEKEGKNISWFNSLGKISRPTRSQFSIRDCIWRRFGGTFGPNETRNMEAQEPGTHGSMTCATTNTARNAKRDCKKDVINSPYDAALYLKNGFSPRHVRFQLVVAAKNTLGWRRSQRKLLCAGIEEFAGYDRVLLRRI